MANAGCPPYSRSYWSFLLLINVAITVVGCIGEKTAPSSQNERDSDFSGAMFRENPARTGMCDERGPSGSQIGEKWRFETRNRRLEASPAVRDSTVYIGSLRDHLYAIDARTSEEKWRSDSTGFFRSSPAIVNGTVYVGNEDRHLYALNAENGAMQWRHETSGPVFSAPAVVDTTVYVGSIDLGGYGDSAFAKESVTSESRLYALDAETGTKRWVFRTGGGVRSSPAVVDGTVYVGSWDGHLYAVDAKTGKEVWRFKTGGKVYTTPAVAGGRVYFGSNDNHVYAVDKETGQKEWQFATAADSVDPVVPRISSPAVAKGTVYIGSLDRYVYALDAGTGKKEWSFKTGGMVASSPSVTGETVYVGSDDGRVYALDAETGEKRWNFDTGEEVGTSSPAIWNGAVYIGTQGGSHLYAIE